MVIRSAFQAEHEGSSPPARNFNYIIILMNSTSVCLKVTSFLTQFQDTGAIPSVYGSSTTNTASTRVNYFQRSGKKARRELFRRDLFLRRAAVVPSENNLNSTNAPISHAAKGSTSQALLRGFFLATTPFVSLKTRRRGKRLTVKISYLERTRGERKALQALSSHLHRSSKQTGVKPSKFS